MSNPIADKIRKLIAHEKSARTIGNLAEAEAFASKVQELLIEHKLSVSEVEDAADPLGSHVGNPNKRKRTAETWSTRLAIAVAAACFCTVVSASNTNSLIFVGREGDRCVAVAMWNHLRDLALDFAATDVKKIAQLRRKMSPSAIRHRYLAGFALAIAVRLAKDRAARERSLDAPGLMLLSTATQAAKDYCKATIRTKDVRLSPPKDSLAFRVGFERGITAPLRKQHTLGVGQ